jgi:hypothetical protein
MDGEGDLDATIEAALERCAVPHPRDMMRRQHDERVKEWMRDIALDKWGPEIEEEVVLEMERKQ